MLPSSIIRHDLSRQQPCIRGSLPTHIISSESDVNQKKDLPLWVGEYKAQNAGASWAHETTYPDEDTSPP